jgi:hypothetical protein
MKPIALSQEAKTKLLKGLLQEFTKTLDNYEFNVNEAKFSYEQNFSVKAKDKIVIRFTPKAYLRCLEMVKSFSSEIGWYGLIRKIEDRVYQVYDIIVCNQKVSGGRVITEDNDMVEFYERLTDDQAEFLHFQAHSHVNMSTSPSNVDLENQASTVKNMGGTGFYLFQIWNKSLDINSFLYDLDNNVFYDRDDIEVLVDDDEFGSVTGFINSLKDKVTSIVYTPPKEVAYSGGAYEYQYGKSYEGYCTSNKSKQPSKNKKQKKEEGKTWYWNDGMGHEGWD